MTYTTTYCNDVRNVVDAAYGGYGIVHLVTSAPGFVEMLRSDGRPALSSASFARVLIHASDASVRPCTHIVCAGRQSSSPVQAPDSVGLSATNRDSNIRFQFVEISAGQVLVCGYKNASLR